MTNLKKILKRTKLSKKDCMVNIGSELPNIFRSFVEAIVKYNAEIEQTDFVARVRLESALLNAKLIESFTRNFPDNYRKGKYGRIIFRFDGCQMIIKKLSSSNKPAYIPTILSESILNQGVLPLFNDDFSLEPILIFGFTKDKYGCISNPRIVYYDGEPQWEINESDTLTFFKLSEQTETKIEVKIKTKERKKQIN